MRGRLERGQLSAKVSCSEATITASALTPTSTPGVFCFDRVTIVGRSAVRTTLAIDSTSRSVHLVRPELKKTQNMIATLGELNDGRGHERHLPPIRLSHPSARPTHPPAPPRPAPPRPVPSLLPAFVRPAYSRTRRV